MEVVLYCLVHAHRMEESLFGAIFILRVRGIPSVFLFIVAETRLNLQYYVKSRLLN